jgi:hypothetical protein
MNQPLHTENAALFDPFDQMERESLEQEAIELALATLATRFVQSEDVNAQAEEARAALFGVEPRNLPDVLEALDPLSSTFELRPLGIQGLEHTKLRTNLSTFLRLALQPAARLQVLMREDSRVVREGEPLDDGHAPASTQLRIASGDATLLDPELLAAAVEANAKLGIFRPADDLGETQGALEDPLPARWDLEAAVDHLRRHLAAAQREFDAVIGWQGPRTPAAVVARFRRALRTAADCLGALRTPEASAAFVASDVCDGVTKALRLAGDGPLVGSTEAADILTRVVLEHAGLVSGALKKDDTSRTAYTRKMRQRAGALSYP